MGAPAALRQPLARSMAVACAKTFYLFLRTMRSGRHLWCNLARAHQPVVGTSKFKQARANQRNTIPLLERYAPALAYFFVSSKNAFKHEICF